MKRIVLWMMPLILLSVSCDSLQFEKKKDKIWQDPPKKTSPNTVPWKGQAVGADTFIKIAKKADLAVVNIGTTKIVERSRAKSFHYGPKDSSPFEDFFGDEFFKRFFGDTKDIPEKKQHSLGSGFVISEDGYIVTNNHVIDKADEITVTIGKDQEYKAKVVGADPKTDVALLKIKPKTKLTTLVLGNSDELQVGEIVVAIGNPFGFSHTVTQGIVSAKQRAIDLPVWAEFIQTDASINPGNSGGPLLNLRAEVIGINTAIAAMAQGIGFAIPINLAKNIFMQLKEKGSVTRGWLGVYIQNLDEELAKSMGLEDRKGALVSSVQQGSPAHEAGIKQGDVIIKFGDRKVDDFNDLPRYVAQTPVGKEVDVVVNRRGEEKTIQVKIGELKGAIEEGRNEEEEGVKQPSKVDLLGLYVSTLTKARARDLDLPPGTQGVVIDGVTADSPAMEKGIRRGDVIIEVNRKSISGLKAYNKALKSLKKGGTALLLIMRPGGRTLFVAITL